MSDETSNCPACAADEFGCCPGCEAKASAASALAHAEAGSADGADAEPTAQGPAPRYCESCDDGVTLATCRGLVAGETGRTYHLCDPREADAPKGSGPFYELPCQACVADKGLCASCRDRAADLEQARLDRARES